MTTRIACRARPELGRAVLAPPSMWELEKFWARAATCRWEGACRIGREWIVESRQCAQCASEERGKEAMTILQDVERFVARLRSQPVCDECVADRLSLSCHIANRKTRELAGRHGFERRKDVCSLCNATKIVIYHR